jgi:hypothetical protein
MSDFAKKHSMQQRELLQSKLFPDLASQMMI